MRIGGNLFFLFFYGKFVYLDLVILIIIIFFCKTLILPFSPDTLLNSAAREQFSSQSFSFGAAFQAPINKPFFDYDFSSIHKFTFQYEYLKNLSPNRMPNNVRKTKKSETRWRRNVISCEIQFLYFLVVSNISIA